MTAHILFTTFMFLARPLFPTKCLQPARRLSAFLRYLSPTAWMLFPLLFVGGTVPSGFFGAGFAAVQNLDGHPRNPCAVLGHAKALTEA